MNLVPGRKLRREGGIENVNLFSTREELLASLRKRPTCDILIVGGGIHGAAFARLSALNGLSTILLERDDYASATSSRSSKMAHGGLRYLEMFDFKQVFEGIRAREDLFGAAPHIVHPHPFLIPVPKDAPFFRWKLAAGLSLYDLFVRKKERRHRWLRTGEAGIPSRFREEQKGYFLYYDGLMSDVRLVLENILAARGAGARCLNYARVETIRRIGGGKVRVEWSDLAGGERLETEARTVVNCAGPWVAELGRESAFLSERIRYSQGAHLLFHRPWDGPALFLPMEGKSRYYFVWPHFSGAMVGTTEREIAGPVMQDPVPFPDEIDEILARIDKDLPGSGLDRSTLHYAFAGVRTLPLRGSRSGTARLSRRHIWNRSGRVFTLIGGKFTTAAWTVYEGLNRLCGVLETRIKPERFRETRLPGAVGLEETAAIFREEGRRRGIDSSLLDRTLSRLGSRAGLLLRRKGWMEPIEGGLLRGEVELALEGEQAETLEDLMRRRLELEYLETHGFSSLPAILRILAERRPRLNVCDEEQCYRDRLDRIRELIGITPLPDRETTASGRSQDPSSSSTPNEIK